MHNKRSWQILKDARVSSLGWLVTLLSLSLSRGCGDKRNRLEGKKKRQPIDGDNGKGTGSSTVDGKHGRTSHLVPSSRKRRFIKVEFGSVRT